MEKNNYTIEIQNEKKIRINKFLSDAGFCSRREADRLVEEGRVLCEGSIVLPGEKVLPDSEITVDGKPVKKEEKKIILLFHKPKGIVCSTRQQKDEITVIDYLQYPVRIYPIGRLDKESEGLLLLTNQGEIVNKIMRAGNYHEKEYLVKVDKSITEDFIKRMSRGVPILDTVTRPCKVIKTGEHTFRIILTQGLNRQIRRMCQYLGYKVLSLKRIRIMNLLLDGIEEGKYREITSCERKELEERIGNSSNETIVKSGGYDGYKNPEDERISRKTESSRKSILSGRQRNHEQSGVRQSLRSASGTGKRNRNRAGK